MTGGGQASVSGWERAMVEEGNEWEPVQFGGWLVEVKGTSGPIELHLML